MSEPVEVAELLERVEILERNLDKLDATLDRIERAVRTLSWGEPQVNVRRRALGELGDFPRVPDPDDSSVHPTPRDGFPVERPE